MDDYLSSVIVTKDFLKSTGEVLDRHAIDLLCGCFPKKSYAQDSY